MLFVPSARDDISRYYKNTYVKFHETGDRLFYIKGVNTEKVFGIDEDGNDFILYLAADKPYEVDYILPRKSYFQYENRALILLRIPAKQYQRGVSEANTKLLKLMGRGSFTTSSINFDTLKAFVGKQQFPSFTEAMKTIGEGSIALSPRFAFACKTRGLYLDQLHIGSVARRGKMVRLFSPLFVKEVSELVKDTTYKVIVNDKGN